jgi:Tfp pilus assembly protein PilF
MQPGDANQYHARGVALVNLEKYPEALASFDHALKLAPGTAPTYLWRGRAHAQLGQLDAAIDDFDRALKLAPTEFEAHLQRGIALARLERSEESLGSFDEAVRLDRNNADALNNRGAVLVRLSRPAEALDDFVNAVRCKPDYADAYTNLGNTQKGLGRYREALQSFDTALSLKPDDAMAIWSKAVLKLAMGALRDGWPLYEARLRLETNPLQPLKPGTRWSGGESLEGRALLVYAEQGLGDTLQFCRYIAPLEALGARVVFEVQPVLKKLLGSLEMRGTLVGRGEPWPPIDLHTPLGSLPLAFGTELGSIPGGVPYLKVGPRAVSRWQERLAAVPGLKVGINWHGNPEAEKRAALQARSFPLAAAAPLSRLPQVSLVSLQKGAGAEQIAQVGFGGAMVQLTDPNFMGPDEIAEETAAIMMGLDLVITADTAIAHLAGALGVPVWVVLQSVPDWRWLIDRSDSPWYPSMRLFRQLRSGDWPEVFERVANELTALRK